MAAHLQERRRAGSRCATLDGKLVREVPLPGIGTVGGVIGDEDDDEAYFSFTSFTDHAALVQDVDEARQASSCATR